MSGAGPLLRGAPGQLSKSYEFYKGFEDSGRDSAVLPVGLQFDAGSFTIPSVRYVLRA